MLCQPNIQGAATVWLGPSIENDDPTTGRVDLNAFDIYTPRLCRTDGPLQI
jgi:hypothetical protein